MTKVFLITKLKTTNIGNETLSNEIINLFSGISKKIVLNVNGRPFGLDGYYLRRIIKKNDPVEVVEKWADAIVQKINKEQELPFISNLPQVRLLKNGYWYLKNESLKVKLRPLKRVIISFMPYSKEYRQRACILKSADWLIYSGAGEVGDNIVFLRQLVEIRVAQKLGIKTAAVNQSVVIRNEPFKKLVGYIYGQMSKIVIRGELSRKNLLSCGVPADIIEVAPDSAINFNFKEVEQVPRSKNLVAINITPRIKITKEQIGIIITQLQALGKKLIFITNEPHEDRKMAHLFTERFYIEFVNNFTNYHDYMLKLAECDFVISARLHTNILALITNTPIIPIEGNIFKSAELLTQLQYPVTTLNSDKAGWVTDLLKEITNLMNNYYDLDTYFNDVLPVHKKSVIKNASWIKEYV